MQVNEQNCPFCGALAGCTHDQKRLPFVAPVPAKTGTLARIEQRIGAMRRERKRILDGFEKERAARLARARAIARALSATQGSVTVFQVHDTFVQTVRDMTWEDENGRTYWAGAVFRQAGWEAIGRCESPYNHNDQNKVWRWTGGIEK